MHGINKSTMQLAMGDVKYTGWKQNAHARMIKTRRMMETRLLVATCQHRAILNACAAGRRCQLLQTGHTQSQALAGFALVLE